MRVHAARWVLGVAAMAAVLAPAGCNIAGPVFYAVHGPGSVEKEFGLDAKRKTVILVDDPANRVAQRRYRSMIGETAQDLLLRKKVIADGNAIDTRAALAMSSRPGGDGPLTIRAIGEAVGADQVVYAVVSTFSAAASASTPAPTATMHVKVIDVATGDRLWPQDAAGYELNLVMPATPGTLAIGGSSDRVRVEESLAEYAGVGLAQVFFDVEVPESVRRP